MSEYDRQRDIEAEGQRAGTSSPGASTRQPSAGGRLLSDQEAALKLANMVSVYTNDVDRGEALVRRRAEVMDILARMDESL